MITRLQLHNLLCALVLVAIFLPSVVRGGHLNQLNTNHDHGLWLEQNVYVKLSPLWSLQVHTNQYWGADYQLLWNHRYQFTFQYDITRFFCLPAFVQKITFGPGYATVEGLRRNTREIYHWVWRHIGILEANINLAFHQWRIQNRVRGDYVFYLRNHYIDHPLLRYRLTVYTPWKFTRWNINPYLSNEWFVRSNTFNKKHQTGQVGGWYLNHFRIGLAADLCTHLSTALYWQWRIVKHRPGIHPRWFNTYQIGVIFNLTF